MSFSEFVVRFVVIQYRQEVYTEREGLYHGETRGEYPAAVGWKVGSEAAGKWLAAKKPLVKRSTYAHYAIQVEKHLLPDLGSVPLCDLDSQMLEEFFLRRLDSGSLHTFATRCVEAGMDIKTSGEIMGHSDASVTMQRYVHPSMSMKKEQIGRLPLFGIRGQVRGQEEK